MWQKRLFALQDGVVCYYRKVDGGLTKRNMAGTISIHQITKVMVVPDQKKDRATDFNLLTTEGRIYKLRSESEAVTRQWVAFIQACDPKRLGCTFPGMVVRETSAQQQEAAANGEAPRGRLVATSAGKTAVSILPSANGASAATSPVPPTPGQKRAAAANSAADQEIVEEKTFWNFCKCCCCCCG